MMLRKMVLSVIFFVLAISVAYGDISISQPNDGDTVPHRQIVRGKVLNSDATVWVIVHPMAVSNLWVQQAVTVEQDVTWNVQIYIGRLGGQDVGQHFEIMAVANPRKELKEGQVLDSWPQAQFRSEVIEVIRGE